MKSGGFKVQADISVKQALENAGWNAGDSAMKKLVEWNFWDGEHGGDIEMLSAYQNILDEYTMQDFGTEEQFVTDERGFCTIFETMAEEINNLTRQYKQRLQMPPEPYEDNRPKGVFTNFNVMNISYEAGGVKVDASNNSNG